MTLCPSLSLSCLSLSPLPTIQHRVQVDQGRVGHPGVCVVVRVPTARRVSPLLKWGRKKAASDKKHSESSPEHSFVFFCALFAAACPVSLPCTHHGVLRRQAHLQGAGRDLPGPALQLLGRAQGRQHFRVGVDHPGAERCVFFFSSFERGKGGWGAQQCLPCGATRGRQQRTGLPWPCACVPRPPTALPGARAPSRETHERRADGKKTNALPAPLLPSPPGSPYQGGVFFLDIHFPPDYPFKAPKVRE